MWIGSETREIQRRVEKTKRITSGVVGWTVAADGRQLATHFESALEITSVQGQHSY